MGSATTQIFQDGSAAAGWGPSLVRSAFGFIASTAFAILVMVGVAALQP